MSTDDEKKKKLIEDLDNLSKAKTSILKKKDLEKMLGDYAKKNSQDMINDFYAELVKKKNPTNDGEEK